MNLAELGEIAKAYAELPEMEPGYRKSRLAWANPRSQTRVEHGTGIQRIGGPLAGGTIGSLVGGAADVATKNKFKGLGTALGTSAGATAGYHRNIKSGNTVAYNRRTGERAATKGTIPYVGTFNIYGGGRNKPERKTKEYNMKIANRMAAQQRGEE